MSVRKKLIKTKSVTVSDLLGNIETSMLEDVCKELNADKWVIKLKTVTVFKLVLYSLLDSTRLSLRTMEDNYSSAVFRAIDASVSDEGTAHSSIRDRLMSIKVGYFERIYATLYKQIGEKYGTSQFSKYNLKRYDSTMIAVFSHLLEGMKVGNSSKKNQVKMTTELVNDFQVRMKFFTTQDHLGEEVALKEVIQEATHQPNDLIVFDRGIKSRQTFKELKDKQTNFVTRLNANTRYKFVREHQAISPIEHPEMTILQDSIVHLYTDGNNLFKEEFRFIEAIRKEDNTKIIFLTNVLDLSAYMIGYIYRQRWQIEVFFRFIKQEMNMTHFVCNDPNAIQVMIYCTLIAAMLMLVYKKLNNIKSYKFAKIQFFKELQAAVILELLETDDRTIRFKKYLKLHL